MVGIPLTWQLQIQGAENVKSRLNDLNGQFERGEITTEQYASGLRSINRDARVLSNTMNIQKNIFLATHPTINILTRAFSIFGSVARAAAAGLQLLRIGDIVSGLDRAGLLQAEADLAQHLRKRKELIAQGKVDTKEWIENEEQINIDLAIVAEERKRIFDNQVNSVVNWVIALSLLTSTIVQVAPKLKILATELTALNLASLPLAATLGIIALAVLLMAAAVFVLIATWQDFKTSVIIAWGKISKVLDEWTIKWVTFWNGLIKFVNDGVNTIIGGVEVLVNSIIKAINRLISAYNSLPFSKKISLLSEVTLPRLNLQPLSLPIKAEGLRQENFGVTSTTNPGQFISPSTTSGVGGRANVIQNITVQGSIVTENSLKDVFDRWLKEALKSTGFS